MLLTGLRGVGKTVLLSEMNRMADKAGHTSIYIEAQRKKHAPRDGGFRERPLPDSRYRR
jgi:adenylate kinase